MKIIFLLIIFLINISDAKALCEGRMIDPIGDVCWECIFPMDIGEVEVSNISSLEELAKQQEHKVIKDTETEIESPLCVCPKGNIPVPGIKIGFWEPHLLVDVTRTPYCAVSLGGLELLSSHKHRGGLSDITGNIVDNYAFYHVHLYHFPLFSLMNLFADFVCLDKADIDIAWITELDPTWDDSYLAAFLHPEMFLFGNIAAKAVCAADCIASTAHKPINILHWCAGCQGGTYPFIGHTLHKGGVSSSVKLTQKMLAKMHRQGLMWDTSSKSAICGKHIMPWVKKTQYRMQMTYPVPTVGLRKKCANFGEFEGFWGSNKTYPIQGEDFGYLIWRKRNCCAL